MINNRNNNPSPQKPQSFVPRRTNYIGRFSKSFVTAGTECQFRISNLFWTAIQTYRCGVQTSTKSQHKHIFASLYSLVRISRLRLKKPTGLEHKRIQGDTCKMHVRSLVCFPCFLCSCERTKVDKIKVSWLKPLFSNSLGNFILTTAGELRWLACRRRLLSLFLFLSLQHLC